MPRRIRVLILNIIIIFQTQSLMINVDCVLSLSIMCLPEKIPRKEYPL